MSNLENKEEECRYAIEYSYLTGVTQVQITIHTHKQLSDKFRENLKELVIKDLTEVIKTHG